MGLTEHVERVRRGLELARLGEAGEIATAVRGGQVVGVIGEAEVGKTETIRQSLGDSTPELAVLAVDLSGAASEAHLSFRLAREIAAAFLGSRDFSVLKVGALVPDSIKARQFELVEVMGLDGLDEALRPWPSGRYELASSLMALEALASRRETIVWLDHLEAPGLTPRHPLSLDHLLWSLRELVQRTPRLSLVLSGRAGLESRLVGGRAAFHQQGRWLSLDYPPLSVWQRVGSGLGVSDGAVHELVELTEGHPETMLLAFLDLLTEGGSERPEEVVGRLVSTSGGLANRALEHAETLYRLGGQVLFQVAIGARPYGKNQRGAAPTQEITKVLARLRQAGLVRHDPAGWSVVNPLIAIALRRQMRGPRAADDGVDAGSAGVNL